VQRTSSGTQGVVAATQATEILLGSLVIGSATARYLAGRATHVTVVAMGSSAQERSEEDELGAAFIAARLRGESATASLQLRATEWEDWFPRRDAELALEVDRFSFALPVYRENGLLVARPVRV